MKIQNVNINEPFKGLFTQGMVCHETYKDKSNNWRSPDEVSTNDNKNYFLKDNPNEIIKVGPSESMSKSKKNTIDPENMINLYGADAVRLFILSDSPPEKDVQWSDTGMLSSYKFVQKFWDLHQKLKLIIELNPEKSNISIDEFINQMIAKMTENLEKFRYNVLIANLHEIYNFLSQIIKQNKNFENLKDNYFKIFDMYFTYITSFII